MISAIALVSRSSQRSASSSALRPHSTPAALSRPSIRRYAWKAYARASSGPGGRGSSTSIAARLASSASALRPRLISGIVHSERLSPSARRSPSARESAIASRRASTDSACRPVTCASRA